MNRKTCLLTCAAALLALAVIAVIYMMYNCDKGLANKELSMSSMLIDGFEGGGRTTVEYYAMEGCPHCKAFDPIWNAVKADVEASDTASGVVLHKYDVTDPQGKEKASDAGVTAFPHVRKVSPDGEVTVFSGKREEASLKEFCEHL